MSSVNCSIANSSADIPKILEPPLCDRCHNIKHHDTGVSIHHPSIYSIQDTIFESPHKHNHVYHVIDAADFPMSLIPGLHKILHITPQRSLNRRSKTGRYYHGQKTEVSFIITRSDLLAPKKEHVDSMMPYLRDVLRDALGRAGKDARLGNIRCVSAKQSWWTKELKEDIWKRGGGGWMVGKANVGKSQLFGEIFPKGRRGVVPFEGLRSPAPTPRIQESRVVDGGVIAPPEKIVDSTETNVADEQTALAAEDKSGNTVETSTKDSIAEEGSAALELELDEKTNFSPIMEDAPAGNMTALENREQLEAPSDEYLDTSSLLPPAQEETDYPEMPLVSSLPGTTASPIRVPFGNGRGELIDLPGLARGDIELHVQPEHRSSLIMRSRIRPEQQVIKPGQSLLLGGFIRITPTTPDVIFLAYTFNPLKPHLTSTERAIGTQTQTREANVENISVPGTGEKIASAGTFHLKWDVTRQRTGPVTSREAAKIKVENLPYRVMAADILIESVGWVEITAQIRKRPGTMLREEEKEKKDAEWAWKGEERAWGEKEREEEIIDPDWPTVEVFSPEGRFIGVRKPLNAWLNFAVKPSEKNLKARPRKSMKGAKKNAKIRARASASAS
jgi:genetic interactor of prohibitins 3, mitochondrial